MNFLKNRLSHSLTILYGQITQALTITREIDLQKNVVIKQYQKLSLITQTEWLWKLNRIRETGQNAKLGGNKSTIIKYTL